MPSTSINKAGHNAVHWRYIESSSGGTYTFRTTHEGDVHIYDPNALPAIGTFGCLTCVGVYFKLGNTACFAAHINAVHASKDVDHDIPEALRVVTPAEGAYVRYKTIRRLEEESKRANWPSVDKIDQVVLVCPVMRDPTSGAPLTGSYVVGGIRDFLDRQDMPVNTEAGGFLVKHATDEVTFFRSEESNNGSTTGMGHKLPLYDNNVDYIAHDQPGSSPPLKWLIDVDEMYQIDAFDVPAMYRRRRGSEPAARLLSQGDAAGDGTSTAFCRRRRHSAFCFETSQGVSKSANNEQASDDIHKPAQEVSKHQHTSAVTSTSTTEPVLSSATELMNTDTLPLDSSDQAATSAARSSTQAVQSKTRAPQPHRLGRTTYPDTGKVYPEVREWRYQNGLCLYGGEDCVDFPAHESRECPLKKRKPAQRSRDRARNERGRTTNRRFRELRERPWRTLG
ncbi:hypothetical protein Q7P37_000752 [Cladosporium fusiforme]